METHVMTDIRNYIVSTWLDGDGRSFDDDTDLHQAGILDSFSTLALIAYLEEQWKAQLDPSDVSMEAFRTVKSLTQLVLVKSMNAKAPAAE